MTVQGTDRDAFNEVLTQLMSLKDDKDSFKASFQAVLQELLTPREEKTRLELEVS